MTHPPDKALLLFPYKKVSVLRPNLRLLDLRYCYTVLVLHSPVLGCKWPLRNQRCRHKDT